MSEVYALSNGSPTSSNLMDAPVVSVVIPVHNEEAQIEGCLQSAYSGFGLNQKALRSQERGDLRFTSSEVEFIIVDANSCDRTPTLLEEISRQSATKGLCVLHTCSPRAGRAQQMNYGAAKASGQLLVFLHADTRLQSDFGAKLKRFLSDDRVWGFCRVSFGRVDWKYKMLSFMINLRSSLFSISTGDQTQFVKADVFSRVGGFPDQPLMEDIELSKALKEISKPSVLKTSVITSSRKWRQEGFWRTVFLMWKLRFSYWRGATPESIHRRYYRSN